MDVAYLTGAATAAFVKSFFRERSPHSPDSENIQNIKSGIKPEEFWRTLSELLTDFKGHITSSPPP